MGIHTRFPLPRAAIESQIEALIALLDVIDGDPDMEQDNEDCCAARDDTGGKHPHDGYGDGFPGDPVDEEDEPDCCPAMDDDPAGKVICDAAAGDPDDAEHDMLGRGAIRQARARIARKQDGLHLQRETALRNLWRGYELDGSAIYG